MGKISRREAKTASRIRRLSALRDDREHRDVDADVRATLKGLAGQELTQVRVRRSFVRADHELHDASDRKRPDVADGWPPMAILSSTSKGVALSLALTALMLAQTKKRSVYRGHNLVLPVSGRGVGAAGWTQVLAIPSEFRAGMAGAGVTLTRLEDKRRRQVRDALDRLDSAPQIPRRTKRPIARVALVEAVDRGGPGSRRSPAPVMLLEEGGVSQGPPRPWTLPKEDFFEVPVEFWTSGWVHVLTSSEIANLFMYLGQGVTTAHKIDGATRGGRYGLTYDAWETHQTLSGFGLMDVTPDPARRADGQIVDGRTDHGQLHTIKALTERLKQPALDTVLRVLQDDPP